MKKLLIQRGSVFVILLAALVCVCASASAVAGGLPEKCGLKPDGGPCKGLFTKYYYDTDAGACKEFFYGGCQGTVPFETLEECAGTCVPGAEFRIVVTPGVTSPPYGVFDIEYSKDWKDPKFSVKVNKKDTRFSKTGGGFDTEKQSATIQVPLGASGKKEITVVAREQGKTYTAKLSLDWKAPAMCELLDHTGAAEALFAKADIRLFVFQLKNVVVKLNGKKIAAASKKTADGQGAILTATLKWVHGANTLTVEARDASGKSFKKSFTFYYAPDRVIRQGDTMSIEYGYPGSRSGPFFKFSSEDSAVKLTDLGETAFSVIDKDGWLTRGAKLMLKAEGAAPGTAKIQIFIQDHFTLPEKLSEEIVLKVTAAKKGK